ncbi:MAG: Hsp20/alpha crystallin family protein [Armatimonadia bacterium]
MTYYWDTRREIRELRARVEQAFRAAQQQERVCRPAGTLAPVVDLMSDERGLVVLVDLPGVAKDDVEVQVERGALVISGTKQMEEGDESPVVLRRERTYGTFSRTIPLPDEADLSQVSAKLRQGELEVRIPRLAEAAPRKVEVVVE